MGVQQFMTISIHYCYCLVYNTLNSSLIVVFISYNINYSISINYRYATSFKVMGSTLDQVIAFFFNAPNPSSCTMAPGFTQPLTEINTRRFLEVNCSWRVRLMT
jgi:hypothetical protein